MQIVRGLGASRYSKKKKQFKKQSCFNTYRDGISVIDLECIMDTTGEVCRHLESRYETAVGHRPFMYWIINKEDMDARFGPDNFSLIPKKSESGDICHLVITGLSDDQGKEFVKEKLKPPNIFLCINSECKQLTSEDIKRLGELLS